MYPVKLTDLSTRAADTIELVEVLAVDNVERTVREIANINARLVRIR